MAISMNWRGRLGVPYQGSKNAIARDIIGIMPRGKRFVDLFAQNSAMDVPLSFAQSAESRVTLLGERMNSSQMRVK